MEHDSAVGGAPGGAPQGRPGESELRLSLRRVMVAWIFGAVWLYLVSGAALTRYAQLLGLSKLGFGLLAAVPFVGTLVQIPASYFIERNGLHKPIFIVSGMLHRATWIGIALMPWVLPESWLTSGLLLGVLVSSLVGNVGAPIWVSWMADLIPAEIRGRYFSRRNQLGQVVGLAATLLLGWALDTAQPHGRHAVMLTVSVLFTLAGLSGMADFLCFRRVQPPLRHRPNPGLKLWQMIREPIADRNFRRILAFTATFTFATGYVGPFAWLYLFEEVHATNTWANMLFVIFPLLVTMSIFPFWGRVIDRIGRKPVLIVTSLLLVHGAAVWIFVRGEHWWIGYAALLVATAAWPGLDLALFNVLLTMGDPGRGRRSSSAYMAIQSLVAAVAGVLSGLFGGAVAELLKGWRDVVFGWPITYHGVLFIISGFLRLLAVACVVRFEERASYSTRAALHYMGVTFYSNLMSAAVLPVRWAVLFGRWTYKVSPAARRWRRFAKPDRCEG